ncbi:MAG: HAMP domain-containing sensor histidine kinase [Candidatus Limnocylindrales bacterium]
MIPRGLTGRIVLAFVGLGVALLIAVSASLFLVLRDAHQAETKSSLGNQVVLIQAAVFLHQPAGVGQAQIQQAISDYSGPIVADGGYIIILGPKGATRFVVGNPSSMDVPAAPTGSAPTRVDTFKTADGKQYIYIEPNTSGTRGFTLYVAVPDRSAQRALSDLSRALVIVVIVLLLVGVPIAWLLSRSMTGPMRRLAQAASDLPTRSGESAPLPVEGPTEVRALTERFNAMARELAATRHEETQMLANLRHDLRTPLTSIAGFAEAIADGTASGDRATAAARTIAEEAQRLERLVGELGVVERLREGPAALRPEELDATALLEDAAARFEVRAAAQGVKFEVSGAAPGEPELAFTGDRLAAERILQNLVVNALSVLPKGGHVWLRATRLQLPGRPLRISMSVTDDGPGFPPGTIEKVFERFYRANPSRSGGGSGLGLAIVRELARAHGGEAWAENVAPHGARVSVLLPIVPLIPLEASEAAAVDE